MELINRRKEKSLGKCNDVSIQIHDDSSSILAASIRATLPEKASAICSIYRVPSKLRTGRESRYEPLSASIGPYHREKQNFIITEKHKRWYLNNLINRSTPPQTSLNDIVKAIKDLEVEARESYAEEIHLSSDEFVTMMVVDGCFILEFIYQYEERLEGILVRKVSNDLVFTGTSIVARSFMRDMILLENQLPFVVLNCLFELSSSGNQKWSLNQLLRTFLRLELPTIPIREDGDIQGEHILDFVRNLILPPKPMAHNDKYPLFSTARYSATELRKAGVHFKVNKGATSIMDINFDMDTGVLAIPHILFGEAMFNLIPNLIALEQCHPSYLNEITSYTLLLDSLIGTKDDITLLAGKGIIKSEASEEMVVKEINTACQGLRIEMFLYEELCHNMNQYCEIGLSRIKRSLYKWKTTLKRDYFSSPWTILSLFAAILLLGLTLTQTVYSILSYSS